MFKITLQDLRFRRRQFAIAVIGAGLLFAISLLLAGMAAGFGVEITKTVEAMAAEHWVVAQGAAGRVGNLPPIPASTVAAVAQEPGVRQAAPVAVVNQAVRSNGNTTRTVNLVGYRLGSGLGGPGALTSGNQVTQSGQAVVDKAMGLGVGRRFSVAGVDLRVVGVVSERSLYGGVPNVYVTIHDLQRAVFGGHALIGAVLVKGTPASLPTGYTIKSNSEVSAASLAQMATYVSTINNVRYLMWVIAAIIVAALVYVSALERTGDFAVLKAVGATTAVLFAGLIVQSVLVSLAAAIVGGVLSNFLISIIAQPVYIPDSAYVVLPVSALVLGVIASLVALRRAASVDPSSAFA
jgi:putative ABC transport system permease protein